MVVRGARDVRPGQGVPAGAECRAHHPHGFRQLFRGSDGHDPLPDRLLEHVERALHLADVEPRLEAIDRHLRAVLDHRDQIALADRADGEVQEFREPVLRDRRPGHLVVALMGSLQGGGRPFEDRSPFVGEHIDHCDHDGLLVGGDTVGRPATQRHPTAGRPPSTRALTSARHSRW